ncbi:MAG TPA: MATE family efflux transporter [Lutibacter sp.]|nr:MATE family efflux transporter [Lutibacter sp.]
MLSQYTKEFKNNLQLAIPVIMGSLGHILVGLADDMMVGVLGPIHLAATSLGNSLVFIAISLGIGFSLALTPLISEADGENDIQKGRRIFQHGMILNTSLGVVMFLMLLFARPVLYLLKQPPEVVELAVPYFKIVALSMIPMMIFQGLKQFADGMSQTKFAMKATIIANVINISINFLLIYGIWIFPKLELVGAAIGTLVSRIGMLIILFFMLRKQKIFEPFFHNLKNSEIEWKYFLKIINLGFPTALQILFEVAAFVGAVLLAGVLGAFPQAANQIAMKLASTTFMIAIGVGVATTVRIGNQKGKKDFINLRRIALSNQLMIVCIMFGFSLLFFLFHNYLPFAFTRNQEVIGIASKLLLIAAVFQLSDGLQAVILASLRGLQDVWIPSLLTFISYWIIGFPISYYLGLHTEYKTIGIWIGLSLGLTTSAFLLFLRFNYKTKKLIKQNHANT